jgi:hypothetical protein
MTIRKLYLAILPIILATCAITAHSQGVVPCAPTPTTYTSTLNLTLPGNCVTNFGTLLNNDFSAIDTAFSHISTYFGYTPLNPINNLSDIASPSTALANLGGFSAPLIGTGAPIFACTSTVNNLQLYTSNSLLLYQCSNVTGAYHWNLVGSAGISQLTGDATAGPGAGSQALVLSTVNSSPGSCGDSTHTCQAVVNGKGLVTGSTAVAINVPAALGYTPLSATNTLGTLIPGASVVGSGATEIFNLTGNVQMDSTIPTGDPRGTLNANAIGLVFVTVANLPDPTLATNALMEVSDGVNGADCSQGGGTVNVLCYSDGSEWQSPLSPYGGGATPPPGSGGTVANVISSMTLSSNATATLVGSKPSRKISLSCYTGYSGGLTGTPNLYCTQPIQAKAEAAGGPSQSGNGGTTPGYASISEGSLGIEEGGGVGSTTPASVGAVFGTTTHDSYCSGDPTAPSGVPGFTLPGCMTSATAQVTQTLLSSTTHSQSLFPTGWIVSNGDAATNLIREVWWSSPDFTQLENIEYDTIYVASNKDTYGYGWQYNNQSGTKMFQVATQTGSWRTVNLVPVSGGATLTTYPLTAGHVYHTALTMTKPTGDICSGSCMAYTTLYLEDVTSGVAGQLYNIIQASTGKQPVNTSTTEDWATNEFITQWQIDGNTTAGATATINVSSDTLTAFYLTPGTITANFSEQIGDIGEFDFDLASNPILNSDAAQNGSDTTNLTATGIPTLSSSNYESGESSVQFASPGTYYDANLPATQPTVYSRFYFNTPTLTTSTTGATAIYKILYNNTALWELYLNNNSKNITMDNLVTGATCAVTTTAQVNSLTSGQWPYIDIQWNIGTSSTTGSYTVLVNGNAPADTNCSATGVNTGYTGTVIGATDVYFGYISDSGTGSNWLLQMDNVGFDDGPSNLYSGYLGQVINNTSSTGSTGTPYYEPYLLGLGTYATNGIGVLGSVQAGAGANTIYRCTTAGTLPVGALTISTGNCGASTATGFIGK